jgi:hypothetical protein
MDFGWVELGFSKCIYCFDPFRFCTNAAQRISLFVAFRIAAKGTGINAFRWYRFTF